MNTPESKCSRCGATFTPKRLIYTGKILTKCCTVCQYRNLFDGLGLPMPPHMLDRHTKNPTLTESEFLRKITAK